MGKVPAPTEHQECRWLVEYLEILKTRGKVLNYSHSSNETYTRSWSQKRKNKEAGVMPGMPDYTIITHKAIVFIEMKRVKGGVVSKYQKEWIKNIDKVGGNATICKGFEEAKEYLDNFI